jgi:protein tyrosine phosphatase
MSLSKRKLRRTASNSSLASLNSLASRKIHIPGQEGSDFMDETEIRERGRWKLAPMDKDVFKKLSQSVQPHEAVPEPVRNKRFNRHLDVLPDPRTRVPLPMLDDDVATSYINANYIHGPDGSSKGYICAMGPLPATLKTWWRMIWQEKVTCIVMVTGLIEKNVKKCERYWAPRPGQKVKVADMFVRTKAVSEGKGYLRTLLEIQHSSGQTRQIMHLWYNSWPDHGVPRTEEGRPDPTNLLYMIRDSHRSEAELNEGGPMLTHCSAGVGRSGTVIALDYACQLMEANNKVRGAGVALRSKEREGGCASSG